MAFQNTKNYQNWVGRRKVMTTLVLNNWCKGTPLDATTLSEARNNNIDDNNEVEGLVASLRGRD